MSQSEKHLLSFPRHQQHWFHPHDEGAEYFAYLLELADRLIHGEDEPNSMSD